MISVKNNYFRYFELITNFVKTFGLSNCSRKTIKYCSIFAIVRILHRGETSGRSDDTEESISVRLKVYELDTAPLIDYYKQKNLVVNINAIGEVDNIYNLISGEF
jgi:adenylate kinase family enzyme